MNERTSASRHQLTRKSIASGVPGWVGRVKGLSAVFQGVIAW